MQPNTPAPQTPTVQPGSQGTLTLEQAANLRAEDIGLTFGKMMTEEEFLEYRKKRPGVKVLKKKAWIRIGIIAAVGLVVYLMYRSQRSTYTDWVPSPEDDFAEEENVEEEEAEDEGQEYAEDDYAEESMMLMEPTLDDDEANAMFDPSY